ncbi:hypothetical protein GCM10023195_18510 [Actinoallomurus liliacearum]|uniref:Major facilitator superfamily (MFS) profile domain-containing protein n=1 Tax=Actinoallomurus liliacearum TaxID=1080073 RepID=A0ABP8TFX8_9ACTN
MASAQVAGALWGHGEHFMNAGFSRPRSPWGHVVQAAAALVAGMGVGRFVYTPILPLMHAQAGLSAGDGANLASANYVGYLLGAFAGTFLPRLVRSSVALRGSLLALTVTLAAMPFTRATAAWLVLRLLAGATSALIFVIAVSSLLSHLRDDPAHLPGWAFGGVGAGIAASGLLVLILHSVADWRVAWWASAGLAAALTAVSWNLRPEPAPDSASSASAVREQADGPRVHRWFSTPPGGVIVLASAVAAAVLRVGFPHRMPSPGHPALALEDE